MSAFLMFALSVAPALVSLAFILMALFGGFEDRSAAHYRFRTRRFVSMFAAVMVFSLFGANFGPALGLNAMLSTARNKSETGLMLRRDAILYAENALTVFFPDVFPADKVVCRRAGVSAFVDKAWAEAWKNASCQATPETCVDNEEAYWRALRAKLNPVNAPTQDVFVTMEAMKPLGEAAREIVAKANEVLTSKNSAARMDFDKETAICAQTEPSFWITKGQPLLASHGGLCWGECL